MLNTYANIEAAYECIWRDIWMQGEDMILYGQSIGNGPVLYLASLLIKIDGCGSTQLSGVRHLHPVNRIY